MKRRSIIYSIEIILAIGLMLFYVNFSTSQYSIERFLNQMREKIKFDSLASSFLNEYFLSLLNKHDIDSFVYIISETLDREIREHSIKIEFYDIIKLRETGECSYIFYPLPYTGQNIIKEEESSRKYAFSLLNIYGAECLSFYAYNDWYLILPKEQNFGNYREINISLNVSNIFSKIDPYSIFVFSKEGFPLSIKYVSLENGFLNISLENLYLDIYIVLRIKENESLENLAFLSGRYEFSNIKNAVVINYDNVSISWVTILVDNNCIKNNAIILKYSYPYTYVKPFSNPNITECKVPEVINYVDIPRLIYYGDILSMLNKGKIPENIKYKTTLVFPGLIYKVLSVYET